MVLSVVLKKTEHLQKEEKEENKMKKNRIAAMAAATILTMAIIMATSSMTTAPAAATTATEATTTPPASSSSGLELSPQPIYQEVSRQIGENLINDTHVETTFAASGNLTLPNTTEPIRTTSRGSILISFVDATAIGNQVITTTEGGGGGETAEAKFFGIARFNMEQEGTGRGIVIATVHTNSTGLLAPLNGMILAGDVEFDAEGTSTTTLWEWQSGIPLPTTTTTTAQDLMNTTTTTNATADTNVTAATIPPEEEEVVEEQQQQATPTAPAPQPE
jgi:hypothetical protein